MKELIKITTSPQGEQLVSARDLYFFFGIKSDFNTWCKRMFEYGFEEDRDFTTFLGKSTGGRPSIDYALTMDTAKEISMLQRTDRGKEARQYFIACEKQLREVVLQPMTVEDMIIANATRMKEINSKVVTLETKMHELDARTTNRPRGFTIAGWAKLQKIHVGLSTAAKLGRMASKLCKERGVRYDKVEDPRFAEVGVYPVEVLEEVFSQPI